MDFNPSTIMSIQASMAASDEAKSESLVLQMVENLFSPLLEAVNSSHYFHYQNLSHKLENLKETLSKLPRKKSFKVKIQVGTLCRTIQEKNEENKKRAEKVEHEIAAAFDLMELSEFQKLKETLQKISLKLDSTLNRNENKIEWTPNVEKLQNQYFGVIIQNISTSASSLFDLEFQEEWNQSTRAKTKLVCYNTKQTSRLAQEYCQNMRTELQKIVYFPSESSFAGIHHKIFTTSYNKFPTGCPISAWDFVQAWKQVQDLSKLVLLECENMFRVESLRARKEFVEAEKQIVDFVLEKYDNFVDEGLQKNCEAEAEFGSELGNFTKLHSKVLKDAFDQVKQVFFVTVGAESGPKWEKMWGNVEVRVKDREKNYRDKIKQKSRERKNSQTIQNKSPQQPSRGGSLTLGPNGAELLSYAQQLQNKLELCENEVSVLRSELANVKLEIKGHFARDSFYNNN